jgi:hypothetical protein
MTTNELAWIPDACTLPTVERPLRVSQFDDLFATAIRGVEQVTPTHLRLYLAGRTGLTATVRDLAARESECCSFFDFTITPDTGAEGETVLLDVRVPAPYTDLLGSLARRAETAVTGAVPTAGR